MRGCLDLAIIIASFFVGAAIGAAILAIALNAAARALLWM